MFRSRRFALNMPVLLVLAEGVLLTIGTSSSNTDDVEKLHPTMLEKYRGISTADISKRSTMHFRNFSNYFQGQDLSACTSCGLINSKGGVDLIIKGDVVDPSYKYPWMIRLVLNTRKGQGYCGGSIINANYILTAAHCLEGHAGPGSISIYFLTNTNKLARGPKVQKIFLHPEYRKSDLKSDIALLKLESKIICDRLKNPICLPPSDLKNPEGMVCTAAGWGATKPGPRDFPQELREGKMKIVNYGKCARLLKGETMYMSNFKYCFDGIQGNWQSICQGDSGGPAFYERNGKYYVIGIASATAAGCKPGYPFLLTAVPKHLKWIKEVTESSS